MSKRYVEPTPAAIVSLLEIIFGEGVVAESVDGADLTGDSAARYIDTNDSLVAVAACDAKFVCYAGAALSMVPAHVADEMAASGDITPAIQDNFYEFMNICSKLMMSDTSDHLRLSTVGTASEVFAEAEPLNSVATRHTFNVSLPGYGQGSLNFLVS
ncbi:MAG: hypothetical protein AAF290_00870 [Pseudomonadota bacterium]